MDLGSLEIQIFVSLVVVLGSALVALICDYLKGNNEQLRERNIELRVRAEEKERFQAAVTAVSAGNEIPVRDGELAEEGEGWVIEPVAPRQKPKRREKHRTAAAKDLEWRESAVPSEAALRAARQRAELLRTAEADAGKSAEAAPAASAAVAGAAGAGAESAPMLLERPMLWKGKSEGRPTLSGTPILVKRPQPVELPIAHVSPLLDEIIAASAPKVSEPVKFEAPAPPVEEIVAATMPLVEPMAEVETEVPAVTPEPVAATATAIEPLEATPADEAVALAVSPGPEVVLEVEAVAEEAEAPAEPPARPHLVVVAAPSVDGVYPEIELPVGMIDGEQYRQLLELPNPMSGYVITIGINEFSRITSRTEPVELTALLRSVSEFVQSLLRDGDMGVQVNEELWVLVFRPDAHGLAERRVANLSEKLWDFQLRHLEISTISFAWAAVNAESERLADGVNSALTRMEASRRAKRSSAGRARMAANA